MANPPRPALRAATERPARQRQTRTRSPQPGQVANNTRDTNNINNINTGAVATRRSSQAPTSAIPHGVRSAKLTLQSSSKLASGRSRKRSATALDADAPADARPPTKVTVTQPHGELLRITNGVPAHLGIQHDDVSHGVSATGANVAVTGSAVPTSQPQPQDKRSLRSHDGGSRLKSDLATYFSNYDEIIAGLPEPSDSLDLETPIYIVDEPLKPAKRRRTASPEPSIPSSPSRSRKSKAPTPTRKDPNASLPSPQSSTAFQILDYSAISKHLRTDGEDDPLADSVYLTQHRRAERREKQLRNIEKSRAMHEKQQLERLLDGLLGPDWLKVMGVTGVTDGEKKDWEPKRDYFVKEVEALVDKFRIWKEEEKRLRAEKEAALAAREGEEQSPESDVTNLSVAERTVATTSAVPEQPRVKEQKPPQPRRPPRPHGYLLPPPPPEPKVPFTSFYAKPHLRAAALGKHRHGRNATAFGQPIPDFHHQEFELPDDYTTPDALRAHARRRRLQKRESGAKT